METATGRPGAFMKLCAQCGKNETGADKVFKHEG